VDGDGIGLQARARAPGCDGNLSLVSEF
jgi:hypothetical protein